MQESLFVGFHFLPAVAFGRIVLLFAGCDHEALMLGRWPSKRRHFATERVECCDHGLYIVCVVAGLIFDFFCHVMAAAKKPATGNEPVRFGVSKIGFRDF